jgi:hypothetical protein
MIVLLRRGDPIRFPPVRHQAGRWLTGVLQRLRALQYSGWGGPSLLAVNLLRELQEQEEMAWAISYRDRPTNGAPTVSWVVRGADDLAWAVARKEWLGARTLWAGPNISVTPQEEEGILLHPAIDRCIVPSQWVAECYADQAPALASKLVVWPVGLDTDRWPPSSLPKKHLMIYDKFQGALAQEIGKRLARRDIAFRLIRYGHYTIQEYREALAEAWGIIWLSMSESQGMALLEALSMDVPALVWDAGCWTYRSRKLNRTYHHTATSAPYFDDTCGIRFTNLDDFETALTSLQDRRESFHSRQYLYRTGLDLHGNLQRLRQLWRDL